jgi:hypothetical protein
MFLICIDANIYAEVPVDFFIQSEYKKDTIDYSDITKYYYRERFTVLFSRESALNLSCIYLNQEKDYKYTWNIVLNDISSNFSIITGNYFTHFGSGLLIGKKRIYDPDIFAFRINENDSAEFKPAFTPCNTGNPVFAFNGLGNSFRWELNEAKFAFNAFYSIKERFIDDESYESNGIDSTIDTLDTKTKSEYNHTEPVEIHTRGTMLSVLLLNCLLFESYYLHTDICSSYKKEFLWEHNERRDMSKGISELNGYGFFSEYRDAFFNALIDGTLTQKKSITDEFKSKNEYGYGLLYKLRFTPPFLKMTITGKEVNGSFYSPYASSIGEDYPESAWFFDAEIKPYANLRLASKISSQKKTATSPDDNEIPVIKKEIASIEYSLGHLENFEIAVRRRERTDEKKEVKEQILITTDLAITKFFKTSLAASYNWLDRNHESKIHEGGFLIIPAKGIKINLTYISAYISGNNSIYTVTSPLKDSSTPGFYITQNSGVIVFKSEIKIEGIFLSGRYFHQFNKSGTLHTRLEFYASGYF